MKEIVNQIEFQSDWMKVVFITVNGICKFSIIIL